MSIAANIAGRIYPAKSSRLELIDLLKEVIHAPYQAGDRVSIPRTIVDRVVSDLEHAVLLLDALQDERDRNVVDGQTKIGQSQSD